MAPQKYAIFYKQNLAGDLLRLWRMRWRMPCLVWSCGSRGRIGQAGGWGGRRCRVYGLRRKV